MRARLRGRIPASVAAILVLVTVAGCGAPGPATVTITIRYSAFDPAEIRVPAGVPITFRLVNEDPIDHEWLVGDDAFHAVHRTGTHATHGDVPTEVTVPALATASTTITFETPGRLAYICHLPDHEAYGMVGVLTVEG
jgi:plastocyanin